MKNYLIMMMTLLFPAAAIAQETPAAYRFTLEECIRYALDKNYNRQSLKLSEESAQLSYQQSKDERLPSVSASVSENLTHSGAGGAAVNGSYSVNASLPVYQG